MDLSIQFSKNLVTLRTLKGVSQKDLASMTGISPRMIAHYEKHVSHPSLEKIEIIARALKVSVTELLGIDSKINRNNDAEFLSSVNIRTLKQFKKILQLSPTDRSTIYKMVDSFLGKK
jgi:transcriptional regulator with XRE-family HTH domain